MQCARQWTLEVVVNVRGKEEIQGTAGPLRVVSTCCDWGQPPAIVMHPHEPLHVTFVAHVSGERLDMTCFFAQALKLQATPTLWRAPVVTTRMEGGK